MNPYEESLSSLKTILLTANPTPQPQATAVYLYPHEFWINTTVSLAITAGAGVVATPGSMRGIYVGTRLTVTKDSTTENITVTAVSATTFTATFTNSYTAGATLTHNIVETVPFMTVQQVVNNPFRWGVKEAGRGIHIWEADIRILLRLGQLTKDEQIADAAEKQEPWLKALADTLFTNASLLGTADNIGGGRLRNEAFGDLFEYRIGHMNRGGAATQIYWGIGLRLPIKQTYAQPMKPRP